MKYAIHINQEGEVEIRKATRIENMWDIKPMKIDPTMAMHRIEHERGIINAYPNIGEESTVKEITPYDDAFHPSRVYNNTVLIEREDRGNRECRKETRYVIDCMPTEELKGETIIEIINMEAVTNNKIKNEMMESIKTKIERNIIKYEIDRIEYENTGHRQYRKHDEERYLLSEYDRYVGIIRTGMWNELRKEKSEIEVRQLLLKIETHTKEMMQHASKYVENYKRDIEIDRWAIYKEAALQKGKIPEYIGIYRKNGTNIEILHCKKYFPRKGEKVRYLFGMNDREGVLEGIGAELEHHKRNGNGSEILNIVHHKDGNIKEIKLEEAIQIVSDYKRKMKREWSQENKTEGYSR